MFNGRNLYVNVLTSNPVQGGEDPIEKKKRCRNGRQNFDEQDGRLPDLTNRRAKKKGEEERNREIMIFHLF